MLNESLSQASTAFLQIFFLLFCGIATDRKDKADTVLAKGAVTFGAVGKSPTEYLLLQISVCLHEFCDEFSHNDITSSLSTSSAAHPVPWACPVFVQFAVIYPAKWSAYLCGAYSFTSVVFASRQRDWWGVAAGLDNKDRGNKVLSTSIFLMSIDTSHTPLSGKPLVCKPFSFLLPSHWFQLHQSFAFLLSLCMCLSVCFFFCTPSRQPGPALDFCIQAPSGAPGPARQAFCWAICVGMGCSRVLRRLFSETWAFLAKL